MNTTHTSTTSAGFSNRQRQQSAIPDSPAHKAHLEETVRRLGYTVEIFHVASGWFAAIFEPGQHCALGVAVDQPTQTTALSLAIDDALKATQFDFRTAATQAPIEPVRRRRGLVA